MRNSERIQDQDARKTEQEAWNADVTPESVEEMRRRAASVMQADEWELMPRPDHAS